jgi:hypothetical protein
MRKDQVIVRVMAAVFRGSPMSHLSCTAVSYLQIATVIFAGLAALLWLLASLVKMPSTDANKLAIGDMGEISNSFRRQSRLNAAAALSTALAVILQALLIYAPTCINLG